MVHAHHATLALGHYHTLLTVEPLTLTLTLPPTLTLTLTLTLATPS